MSLAKKRRLADGPQDAAAAREGGGSAPGSRSGLAAICEFVAQGSPPALARQRAAAAIADTIGVTLAGVGEPAARMAAALAVDDGPGDCQLIGTLLRAGAGGAALANGTAAHALDYDDMCFVSLAHPSCALVPAALAAAELADASGLAVVEAYVVGFEVECRLGVIMNPRHYHERGWHCTSSIGTIGAAAAASRVLGLEAAAVRHALGVAASAACGFKENMGSMVKPLHAGLAARNGLMAAQLARRGFESSPDAIDGPQGYLRVMDSQHRTLDPAVRDLGDRWEIEETGITVKLYPSCAATHPPLDVLLDLRARHAIDAGQVEAIEIEVDSMTPRLLIHQRPRTVLEGKFSMPFCAAAAIAYGRIGIDTFDLERIDDADVQALMPRVSLRANPEFDRAAPLSQARVTVRLRDGRVLTQAADGARGYPGRITEAELAQKFAACAGRVMPGDRAVGAWTAVRAIERASVRELMAVLRSG
jgi:2-methylcitrate dehydratase PrpD